MSEDDNFFYGIFLIILAVVSVWVYFTVGSMIIGTEATAIVFTLHMLFNFLVKR